MTYVLIMFVIISDNHIGTVTIPGYPTYEACAKAGIAFQPQATPQKHRATWLQAWDFACVEGPSK